MGDNQNARELLKEARGQIAQAHDHLMELTAKLPMQYFGLVDGNIIQAEDYFIGKIDAYLAAPSESAMEAERKIRDNNDEIGFFRLTDSDAAALIEDYAERETAALRDLVRRMRKAGNMVRDAMPNSVAVHNWIDVCAEADRVLGD